jgi:hypothetical protein
MKYKELSRRQWNELYDKLYRAAQRVFDKHRPCKGEVGKCASKWMVYCCDGCKYLSKKGCKVKSLACKAFTCGACQKNLGEIEAKRLNKINSIGYIFEMCCMRGSKKDNYNSYLRSKKWRKQHEKI